MKTRFFQQFVRPSHEAILEVRTTVNSTSPYAEHFHSSFSFGLILEGCTRFFLGKVEYRAEPGDIVLIAPEQVHSCNPIDQQPRSYHMVHVNALWFHQHVGMILYGQPGLRVQQPLVRDALLFAELRGLLDAVCAESDTAAYDLGALLATMHSRHHCFSPEDDRTVWRAPAVTVCEGAEQIIDGNYSITALAQAAGVSRESFSRSFHRATGLPPSSYLHCLRLEYGRQLLQKGSSVADAAVSAGYVDQSHFHRMFVKYCSVTPGSYRKRASHSYKK